jgi:3-deoxy-D-manno-octulosonate 8-phosphate phosphatase (KDO 8-P phosphatase)
MMPLADRVAAVRLLILDVDGVLTDGSITYTSSGEELKRFHVRDGSGIKLWQKIGHLVAILSGRSSPAVSLRAAELGIRIVHQASHDKQRSLQAILNEAKMVPDQVCAIGDDVQDLHLLGQVGVRVAVQDACPEVRECADYVTQTPGGHGAVRDMIEWLMKSQGRWDQALEGIRPAG